MSRFLSKRLSTLKEYTPGEQPTDMKYVKLNTNESPYPPAPAVTKAVTEGRAKNLQLYSDPTCSLLTDALAAQYGVGRENVIVGNGSDEILSFCFAAYFDKNSPVIFPDISYGFYKVFADLYGSSYKEVPLTEDLSVDVLDYAGKNVHIVIANPNAPTGKTLSLEEIEKIVSTNPDNIVIIDEAYIDFGGDSAVELTKKYENLIVVMTFSKSRSLAGARVGFAIASSALIADLNRIKYSTNPYNVNSMSQAAALAVLSEQEYYDKNCKQIMDTREWFCESLQGLGFEYIPSKANFVFAKHPEKDGRELYLALKAKGVLVRHFDKDRIRDYLRITIGTQEQMQVLINVLKEII